MYFSLMLSCSLSFASKQKQGVPPAVVKPPVKKENQWFDVGIVKVTNMVVTHYYMPADDSEVTDVSIPANIRTVKCNKTKYLRYDQKS